MDNETTAQDGAWYEDYGPEDAAPVDDDAEVSPSDDAEPDETDQPDEDTDDPAEVEEDPREALQRERQARAELEAQIRQRAEQDSQRELERQQREQQEAEQKRVSERQRVWNEYQAEKRRIAQAKIADARRAAESNDPALMAQHLATLRYQEEQTADHKYYSWQAAEQDYQTKQLKAERDRALTREYADYVRGEYNLPYEDLNRILKYSDGTPVEPNAMSARAAELVEARKERANLKRQATKAARDAGKDTLRARSQVRTGRGQGPSSVQEIEGTLEELETLFPRGRHLRRVS